MKRALLVLYCAICMSRIAFAQEGWYIAPSVSMAASTDNEGWSANLVVGRYIGQGGDLRIDVQGNYLFSVSRSDYKSLSVLATTEGIVSILNKDRIYSSASVGLGVMTGPLPAGNQNFTDIIVPFKAILEYGLTDNFSTGLDFSYNINLNKVRQRSVFYIGVLCAFRF